MKKAFSTIVTLILAASVLMMALGMTAVAAFDQANWEVNSTFEGDTSALAWKFIFGNVNFTVDKTYAHGGTQSLKVTEAQYTWASAAVNLYDVFKAKGAGSYEVGWWIYSVDGVQNLQSMIRCTDVTTYEGNPSFVTEKVNEDGQGNSAFLFSDTEVNIPSEEWFYYSAELEIDEEDIAADSHEWMLCVNNIAADAVIWIDDITVLKDGEEATPAPTEEPTAAPTAEPTAAPTEAPTAEPTAAPTAAPTTAPTEAPVKSGCGSIVQMSLIALLPAVFVLKKKK